jgi:hypothetical protein
LMTWSGMASKFLYSPFNRILCGGRCTFIPEMTTHAGKVIVCDFPLLEYGIETGRLISCLVKVTFMKAWLRRDVSEHPNMAFMWLDEGQYFVLGNSGGASRDNAFAQVSRGSRIATVFITQNILNIAESLGEHVPGSKTKALLGNFGTKVFFQQNDTDTNNYAAELIGKEYRYLRSSGISSQDTTFGRNEQLLYKVTPDTFTQLQKPDTRNPLAQALLYAGGSPFNATKTKDCPEGRNYLLTAFSR